MKKNESKRDAIISAASKLFWEKGYESTSPNDVLKRSGAGKGSLYHHFDGKVELGVSVLEQISEDLILDAESYLGEPEASLFEIKSFLLKDRQALKGCKLGRLANEHSILTDERLIAPLQKYFERMLALIEKCLNKAIEMDEISSSVNISKIATLIVSAIQGGYVLTRVSQNEEMIRLACEGAWELLSFNGSKA
ncbi:TetR/AcrR family transcriptional regulator [Aliiglaciecola sp. M165]|uniref:TetR/AcrR family transcriptional regulator n=1 Tax=Aliiglaciecola sp. M165 TaxID=2593649 RepID=UPI001180DF63|nr:TetR/AcrR family transcriptional regulator [Aliiglaciecola sp. M165]TRY32987.1 TetR/AcrR family transcriptional regulator [Aliiglaciecola sp. M165]